MSCLEETLPQVINSQNAVTFGLLAASSGAVWPFLLCCCGKAPVETVDCVSSVLPLLLYVNTLSRVFPCLLFSFVYFISCSAGPIALGHKWGDLAIGLPNVLG